jgi:hypothetical protein
LNKFGIRMDPWYPKNEMWKPVTILYFKPNLSSNWIIITIYSYVLAISFRRT